MIAAEGTVSSESTSVTQSLHPTHRHEDIGEPFGKFNPPASSLEFLEIKLARKGDVEQVFCLFVCFPPQVYFFAPWSWHLILQEGKSKRFLLRGTREAQMQSLAQHLSLWKDLLGGKKLL